ncbi:RtcB family protein [Myxococcota bacterium]|nr:RtcB family protein [Myxococcota bacterium]MBU1430062.1 RtcB family protein [Myxococcota bacterium]MBU1896297.1 RtcB family protein [Myxococcota bacterium]
MKNPYLRQESEYTWKIDAVGPMRVPGLIFGSERIIEDVRQDRSPEQVANVATLPGIIGHSIAMPDIHWGYGFPIGGVAAFDEAEGVVSPGGVGYDINCGVRLMTSGLQREDIVDDLERFSTDLYKAIPSGVGSKSPVSLSASDLDEVLVEGAAWAVRKGYGRKADLEVIEERGQIRGADPDKVSKRAKQRGLPQLGSLGSGNHFCELGYVDEIYDPVAAAAFGLRQGGVTVMLHSGSRGLGYQVCDDSLRAMLEASAKYGIKLPDRQLCAAPLGSPEAADYFGAMNSAVNYAFANRQMMTHFVREAMRARFGQAGDLDLVYDVCHNIAKWETHLVEGQQRRVCVHRKGATRAFGPGHADVPRAYREVGQPVLIPGDMGRYSFVLAGTQKAMETTFGSSCHGAGRVLSRSKAREAAKGRELFKELKAQGIYVRSPSPRTVAEEISEAYKDVADVVEVMDGAGIARKVARLVPLAVVKG